VPRHPPYALKNLTTDYKRCSRPLYSSQATDRKPHHTPAHTPRRIPKQFDRKAKPRTRRIHPDPTPEGAEPEPADPSGPNSAPSPPHHHHTRSNHQTHPERHTQKAVLNAQQHNEKPTSRCSTHEQPPQDIRLRNGPWTHTRQMLLRKEVIQPHLPVRLPCYDFVPIASPTFDGSLHKGWATGFGCYRLS
jgi:hypothetical protein